MVGSPASPGSSLGGAQTATGSRHAGRPVESVAGALGDRPLTSPGAGLDGSDLAEAALRLQLDEIAYRAALAATSRVLPPGLLDFLR